MNLQFISDSTGKTTGVFIPINEWNELKSKFKGIDKEEVDIPQWLIDIVRERINYYKKNREQPLDFDEVMDDIEKDLNTKL
jgi:hypothetical protein